MSHEENQYAIGTDPNNLPTLRQLKIPMPDQVVYDSASLYYVRSDGTRVGDGYSVVGWIYDVISIDRMAALLEVMSGADFAYVYIVTDARDGDISLPSEGFNMYYVIMWRPILSGSEGVPIARSSKSWQSVKINYKILNEMTGYL